MVSRQADKHKGAAFLPMAPQIPVSSQLVSVRQLIKSLAKGSMDQAECFNAWCLHREQSPCFT